MVLLFEFCGPELANKKFGWFKDIEEVRAEFQVKRSPIGKCFPAVKFHVWYPGPSSVLRPTFPKEPRAGSWYRQVLKNTSLPVAGTHSAVSPKSGRCDTPPTPPSEFAKFPLESSTVNQFPVDTLVIPAICQPPTIWFARPVAAPKNFFPWPKGSS